jgi:hypothetical protein
MARSIFRSGAKANSSAVGMAKRDPTKAPEFKRVLGNLLKAPPKPHSEMKKGERTTKNVKTPRKKPSDVAKPKGA